MKGFTEAGSDKFLWGYKKGCLWTPKKYSVTEIASLSLYYEGPEVDNKMENALALIESEVSLIIQGLKAVPGTLLNLSYEDKEKLALFIGFLFTRNPIFREPAKEIRRRMVKMVTDDAIQNDAEIKKMIEEKPFVKELWENENIKVDIYEWAALPEMGKIAFMLTDCFLRKNWKFFVPAKGHDLVTSDNPGYFDNTYVPHAGPAHPLSEVIFHLRKDLALVITPCSSDMNVLHMNNQEVKKFNKGVTRAAREYVYSPVKDEALGRMIAKIKDCSAEVHFF